MSGRPARIGRVVVDRTKLIERIVTAARDGSGIWSTPEPHRGGSGRVDQQTPARSGSLRLDRSGELSIVVPAGTSVQFTAVGGGGAGGNWGGRRGLDGVVVTGVIDARAEAYELCVVAGEGGLVGSEIVGNGPAWGGRGGAGHVPGGDGGWGSGGGAGGGGGGGGASAIFTKDRSTEIVAPGGGGGGGGCPVDAWGDDASHGSTDGHPAGGVPGQHGGEERGGNGGHGTTRNARRGGGGGGGGGGSPAGDGGTGGLGGGGDDGAVGSTRARGAEHVEVAGRTAAAPDRSGRGGRPGTASPSEDDAADARIGRPGHDGAIDLRWAPDGDAQGSSNAGTAASMPG